MPIDSVAVLVRRHESQVWLGVAHGGILGGFATLSVLAANPDMTIIGVERALAIGPAAGILTGAVIGGLEGHDELVDIRQRSHRSRHDVLAALLAADH